MNKMRFVCRQNGGGGKWYGEIIYFAGLLAALLILFLPSFNHPPRSDHWSAFYVFNQVEASPNPPNWPSILTFDLWHHGTYRPLSHFILYLEYLFLSPRFVWYRILNFSVYFVSIIFLYLLGRRLALDRVVMGTFLTVFAFLFSHCDIVTWTFQIFTILGFCAFLLGFILYIDYLQSGRKVLLFPVGILFLFGMLTLEVYALWPLAIFIIPFALPSSPRPRFQWLNATPLLVYLFYLGGWFLHRGTTGDFPSPTIVQLGTGLLLVFFNLAYTGIIVNIVPSLSQPLYCDDNINMGGWLLALDNRLETFVFGAGSVIFLLLLLGAWWLLYKKRYRLLALLSFFFFLYLSNFFTAVAARLTTNEISYPLIQFRYQYVPNGLLALILAAAVCGLCRPRAPGKMIIVLTLIPVLIFNIMLCHRQIVFLGDRLRPLGVMLENIRWGLDGGTINEKARLYISPRVTTQVQSPGWNFSMGQFMEGTFQGLFPAREMKKFSLRREDAAWIITWNSFPFFIANPEKSQADE